MFDVYQLPEEHDAIRDGGAGGLRRARWRPNAAAADENSEFPQASYDALRAADFHAPHIPAEYGGAGADALATAIVIEEVARACASSSLIPAVNKLGTMPLLLAGSERAQAALPAAGGRAARRCSPTACPSPRRAATPPSMTHPGRTATATAACSTASSAGSPTPASPSSTPSSRSPTRRRAPGASPRSSWRRATPGVSFGAPEKKLGIKGSPTREVYFDNVRIPADRMIGAEGTGFAHRHAHPRPHPGHHRRPGRRHRPGRARLRASATSRSASSSASRSPSSRASSSCSPTWA